jgi:ABC-2 type transport system permease protein
VTSAQPRTATSTRRLIFTSLLRADLTVFVKNRRSLVISILLPYLILQSTAAKSSTAHLGGPLFVIGLAITYGLASTSIMGYSLAVARDREKGVFQRLRVTPASTSAIMISRLAVQILANLIIALVVVIIGSRVHHLTLSIGQALVALVKTSETVNSTARLIYIALILLGLLGQGGSLGHSWDTVARWSPVGTLMTLFAGVLNLSAWNSHDLKSLLAAIGYAVVFTVIGIRWFQWDVR